jgi:tetratricopeptide (TPR) repeat protein
LRRGDRHQELQLRFTVVGFSKYLHRYLGIRAPWEAQARLRIAHILMEKGKYQDAAEQCRLMLERPLPPSLEAHFRRYLADCQEGMGQTEQSQKTREEAVRGLDEAEATVDVLKGRGDAARLAGKNAEALEAYQAAIDRLRQYPRIAALLKLEGHIQVSMSLSCNSLGQDAAVIEHAAKALLLPLTPLLEQLAHAMAGLGQQKAGRLDEAETHLSRALELAQQADNAKQVAQRTGQLAGIQRLRGHTREALATCHAAEQAAGAEDIRILKSIEASCWRHLGEWDKALAALDAASHGARYARPAAEAKHRGIVNLEATWILGEADRTEGAARRLSDVGWFEEEKLERVREATGVWMDAMQGKTSESLERHRRLVSLLNDMEGDRRGVQNLCALLGRAAVARHDWDVGLDMWRRYHTEDLEPAWRPLGFYMQGRCLRGRGDEAEARQAFQSAVDALPEGWYRTLAQGELHR